MRAINDKNVNKYLLVKAKGGMGNRMLCAVTGVLYGNLTERWIIVCLRLTTENARIKLKKVYPSIEV